MFDEDYLYGATLHLFVHVKGDDCWESVQDAFQRQKLYDEHRQRYLEHDLTYPGMDSFLSHEQPLWAHPNDESLTEKYNCADNYLRSWWRRFRSTVKGRSKSEATFPNVSMRLRLKMRSSSRSKLT